MFFDGKLSPETVAFVEKMHLEQTIWTTFGPLVTLTFDLLTSKSIQFIFILDCTYVVNLAKFQQAVCKISCLHGQPKTESLRRLIAAEVIKLQ